MFLYLSILDWLMRIAPALHYLSLISATSTVADAIATNSQRHLAELLATAVDIYFFKWMIFNFFTNTTDRLCF